MPFRLVVRVASTRQGDTRQCSYTGPQLHGAVLARVHETSPMLAQEIHDAQPSTPFALTEPRPVDDGWRFELGVLAEDLTEVFATGVSPGTTLRLGSDEVSVLGCETYGRPYSELVDGAPDDSSWTFEFLSPVGFKLPDVDGVRRAQPLPEPDLVFGSLLRRWRRFAPDGLLPALEDVIATRVVIADARLRTKRFTTKPPRVWQLGSMGSVTFATIKAREQPREILQGLSALASFAVYAGVGDGTPKGMGHTTVRPPRDRRPRRQARTT